MNGFDFDLPQELHDRIVEYIEERPVIIYWDHNDVLDEKRIEEIIENGLLDFEAELFDYNMNNIDYITELENNLLEDVHGFFSKELESVFQAKYPDEEFEWIDDEISDYLARNYRQYIAIDLNMNELLNKSRITAMVVVYSNYDCATSMQGIDDTSDYLGSVYQRVKHGVREEDYLKEFINSYTASVLVFPFKINLKDYLDLLLSFEESAIQVHIPKGTQFGFFSEFNGSGSTFEAETVEDMTLPIIDPDMSEYDHLGLKADVQNAYSMKQVYGDTRFIHESDITVS